MLDHHRSEQLVTRTWFTPARMVEGVVRFESPCFEGWEPTALGYQLQFQVRRGAAANELATAFALQMKNCIDPASVSMTSGWEVISSNFAFSIRIISVRSWH